MRFQSGRWPLFCQFFLFFNVLVLLSSGCGRREDPGPSIVSRVDLDRDQVEQNALLGRWQEVLNHLLATRKPEQDDGQCYILFWKGVAEYNLGNKDQAVKDWQLALHSNPSDLLREQIVTACQQVGSYAHETFFTSQTNGEQKVLQFGIFQIRKKAEDLTRELLWRNLEVHVKETRYNSNRCWVVLMGPLPKERAENVRNQLLQQGVSSIIKSANEI